MFTEHLNLTEHSSVEYVPQFLQRQHADYLLQNIDASLQFHRPPITLYGRTTQLPRSVSWIADDQLSYGYSGISTEPMPWPTFLMPTRLAIETRTGCAFNSVLVNRYQDGNDMVGWHSDDEPELGATPNIASLSLGATRRFLMRDVVARTRYEWNLGHGDLLVMSGRCQLEFEHSVPRAKRVAGPRINLTFRYVHARATTRETVPSAIPNNTGGRDNARR
jgi:alkylated DNA repair dioxygenase AlkB